MEGVINQVGIRPGARVCVTGACQPLVVLLVCDNDKDDHVNPCHALGVAVVV